MAPMRMKKIGHDVKKAREVANIALEAAVTTEEKTAAEKNLEYLDAIFNTDILKPAADTYLSPEWDELLPFPTSEFNISCVAEPNYY